MSAQSVNSNAERQRRRAARLLAAGICKYCGGGADRPGKTQCSECAWTAGRTARARYHRRKIEGLCTRCSEAAADRGTLCYDCNERKRTNAVARKPPHCTIYAITFPAVNRRYIGMTEWTLRDRMNQHLNPKQKSVCWELKRRLHISKEDYEVEIIGTEYSVSEARERERREIQKLPAEQRINTMTPQTFGSTAERRQRDCPRIPDDRPYTCSVCRIQKRAKDFQSDRSRSVGISSKCRECFVELTKLYKQFLREGHAEPWQRAKSIVQRAHHHQRAKMR